jgi:predicted metal-dependent hydrolase
MPEQLEFLSVAEAAANGPDLHRLHVRESARARRMFLHVRPPLGVELVVPRGTRARVVQSFVEAHRQWIEAAWAQIENEYVGDRSSRPDSIDLPAIERSVRTTYRYAPDARTRWHCDADRLDVNCQSPQLHDASEILRAWLMSQARRVLPAWVFREAARVGDSPKRVQVRLQRTRWGSCSATGTISVNAALLFLAPELIRYLIVHELCHIRHMNHSRAYWRHVAGFEAEYRRLDAALGRSWSGIPWWVLAN